ncbi:hypothetical protein Btru_051496 [Bulinus truncatus]|nr:hypothetical protein Btru_051496 [Bulinus truncatus]
MQGESNVEAYLGAVLPTVLTIEQKLNSITPKYTKSLIEALKVGVRNRYEKRQEIEAKFLKELEKIDTKASEQLLFNMQDSTEADDFYSFESETTNPSAMNMIVEGVQF